MLIIRKSANDSFVKEFYNEDNKERIFFKEKFFSIFFNNRFLTKNIEKIEIVYFIFNQLVNLKSWKKRVKYIKEFIMLNTDNPASIQCSVYKDYYLMVKNKFSKNSDIKKVFSIHTDTANEFVFNSGYNIMAFSAFKYYYDNSSTTSNQNQNYDNIYKLTLEDINSIDTENSVKVNSIIKSDLYYMRGYFDNLISVAVILAIIKLNKKIPKDTILFFTNYEETTMQGAEKLSEYFDGFNHQKFPNLEAIITLDVTNADKEDGSISPSMILTGVENDDLNKQYYLLNSFKAPNISTNSTINLNEEKCFYNLDKSDIHFDHNFPIKIENYNTSIKEKIKCYFLSKNKYKFKFYSGVNLNFSSGTDLLDESVIYKEKLKDNSNIMCFSLCLPCWSVKSMNKILKHNLFKYNYSWDTETNSWFHSHEGIYTNTSYLKNYINAISSIMK